VSRTTLRPAAAGSPRPGGDGSDGGKGIPFWRNVKTIGVLAQVVFVAVVLAGVAVLVSNVTTALSRANLPADFSWLGSRAGIPIAETPIPYTTNDPYWRALLIGFLNTLRVALVGVVLATVIGIGVGLARLSANWLVRTIAGVYVELLRNIPLAVQIVFWYTAILLPFPPRVNNPIELPGGVLLSNVGMAIPFLYPSYRFGAWLPWLALAAAAAVAATVWGVRSARRADLPRRVWPLPVGLFVLIAGGGYLAASAGGSLPDGVMVDFNIDRGRGIVFVDADGDGRRGAREAVLPYASTIVRVEAAELVAATQNITESRRDVPATFRFPLLRPHDAEDVLVEFVDEAAAAEAGYRIHFLREPSRGVVYVDRNGNGVYDRGEEVDPATGIGYGGVELVMTVRGYERPIVADRDGQIRTPAFQPAGSARAAEAAEAAPAAGRGVAIFGTPARGGEARDGHVVEPLRADVELRDSGPLVLSRVHAPVSGYEGGLRLTVNYLALLFALVIYTSAFIGEIVRGGIQAVARGQNEAALALGLSPGQTFRLVVFPQALRIVLPPMISQYLNLTKNSSLAPLAAYGELFVIATITANQTGASVPVAFLLIVSYLLVSLAFAFVLNLVNDRIALVER
jgi:His/Glu/Gln/Arg/opine family amino acid ABC transporter permease subunit